MDFLRTLRVLVSVAQSGGFSKTARELCMSTSSVARQMDALEAIVGAKLLVRSTRKIGLTEQGQQLLLQGGRILQEVDTTLASVRDRGARPSGVLRITAAPSLGRSILPSILKPFLETYPDLDVDLVLTDAVIDLVETGIDIAIRVSDPDAYPDLIVRDLLPMRRIVCASNGYLRANGRPSKPSQLTKHSCLLFRPQDQHHPWMSKSGLWTFRKSSRPFTVRVVGRLSSSDADALVTAARSDLGIIVMPDWMVAEDIRAGTLVRLLETYDAGEANELKTLHLAYQHDFRDSPKISAFRSHMYNWFNGLDHIDEPALV